MKDKEMANIPTKEEIEARNKIGKEKDELRQALLHYATAEASGGIKSLIDCEGCTFYLYEMLGYRKIPEDSVVLSREEQTQLKSFVQGEWVDTKIIEKALNIDFSTGFNLFEFSRIAEWNKTPLNGQNVTTEFKLKDKGKETAEKILDFIQENRHKYEMWYLVSELRKFFGIEQNNDWVFGDLADELNNKFGVEIKE